MIVKYSKKFKKSYKKLDSKIKEKSKIRINIFEKNPFFPDLNNHKLKWEYKWHRSINITWDYRAIFRELWDWNYEFIEFIDIWTHSFLY